MCCRRTRWRSKVERPSPGERGNAVDNPAITLFGETPNVMWLQPQPGGARTALWVNDDPQRSFCYRVHLLWRMPDGRIVPITDDPIIHNDPPSDF